MPGEAEKDNPGQWKSYSPLKNRQYVNEGMEDQMEIQGYIRSPLKTFVVWIFIIITFGLLRLFFAWFPDLYLKVTHRQSTLDTATSVLLKDQYLQRYVSKMEITIQTSFLSFPINNLLSSMKSADLLPINKLSHSDQHTPLLSSKDVQDGDVFIRYFITKEVKYLWNEDQKTFEKLRGLEDSSTCDYFHQMKGINKAEQIHRRAVYGENRIEIKVTPLLELLFTQVLSPFYMFQFLASILWMLEWYYYYAGFLIVVSVVSIIIVTYQTRKLQVTLRSTIDLSTRVTVFRNDRIIEELSSDDLVPGDVIEIPRSGCTMQCDAVLLTGNCIVNESMLTGESVPITKTPLPNPKMSRSQGYNTAKGELIRSILFPKPVEFKFQRDTYAFLAVLGFLALFGFIYTIVLMVGRNDPVYDMILAALDLVTIAVPPALPAALTVGVMFAQKRLKQSEIFCISPNNISVSGTLNVFCFDKTGTLTEEGLNLHGVLPVEHGRFTKEIYNFSKAYVSPITEVMASCHSLTYMDNVISGDPIDVIMFQATKWEMEEPGEEHTRFDILAPTVVRPVGATIFSDSFDSNFMPPGEEIGIIRQFPFSSSLQRMSVITRRIGADSFDLYTKGAPETIASLSKPETVPEDLHDRLSSYTRRGYRVLALASNKLPRKLKYAKVQRIQREHVEKNLTFLGLVVFENRLKSQTSPVIHELKEANIRPVMVTGDNMLTAISVARECGMIETDDKIILVKATSGSTMSIDYFYTEDVDNELMEIVTTSGKRFDEAPDIGPLKEKQLRRPYHFVVEGHSWAIIREHFPDLVEKMVVKGTVFARMSSEQKSQLVESLQDIGYYVGMCGDGANDCGALKTAHASLSLSDLEASVASSFTYRKQNITGVPTLIREGRAALVTSMGIFKYMAMYSLTMFVSVCILYWINANMTDFEFLYIDMILLTSLSVTLSFTGAYHKLHKDPPLAKLVSVGPILSLLLQTFVVVVFQTFAYLHVTEQPWFYPFEWNEDYDYTCYEANAVFIISSYQYVATSIAFSVGKPYRKSIASNYPFLVSLIVCVVFNIWFTIHPGEGAQDFMQLLPPPSYTYRLMYLGIAFINSVITIVIERYFINSKLITVTLQTKLELYWTGTTYKYLDIEKEMNNSSHWPPVPKRAATMTEIFGRLDNHIKIQDFETSLSSSLLDSSCSSYLNSLHSTSTVCNSDSYNKDKHNDLLGSLGKKQDSSSMGAIYPYLTEPEEFSLPYFTSGKTEGFSNHCGVKEIHATKALSENYSEMTEKEIKQDGEVDKADIGSYDQSTVECKKHEELKNNKENSNDDNTVVTFVKNSHAKKEDVSHENKDIDTGFQKMQAETNSVETIPFNPVITKNVPVVTVSTMENVHSDTEVDVTETTLNLKSGGLETLPLLDGKHDSSEPEMTILIQIDQIAEQSNEMERNDNQIDINDIDIDQTTKSSQEEAYAETSVKDITTYGNVQYLAHDNHGSLISSGNSSSGTNVITSRAQDIEVQNETENATDGLLQDTSKLSVTQEKSGSLSESAGNVNNYGHKDNSSPQNKTLQHFSKLPSQDKTLSDESISILPRSQKKEHRFVLVSEENSIDIGNSEENGDYDSVEMVKDDIFKLPQDCLQDDFNLKLLSSQKDENNSLLSSGNVIEGNNEENESSSSKNTTKNHLSLVSPRDIFPVRDSKILLTKNASETYSTSEIGKFEENEIENTTDSYVLEKPVICEENNDTGDIIDERNASYDKRNTETSQSVNNDTNQGPPVEPHSEKDEYHKKHEEDVGIDIIRKEHFKMVREENCDHTRNSENKEMYNSVKSNEGDDNFVEMAERIKLD